MNKYLRKVEEQHLRKEAGIGTALGIHAVQSAVTNRILKSPKFAGSIATHATAGFKGKAVPKNKLKEAVKGLVSPEAAVLQREAHHLGGKLRKKLTEMGVDPDTLSKRDLVQLRRLTKGDFSKVITEKTMNSPVTKAYIEMLGSTNKIPPEAIKKLTSMQDPIKRQQALKDLESVWNKKSNPLTSNIAKNITRPSKDVSQFAAGSGKDSTAEMVTANLLAAPADPFTAAFNASKAFLASDAAAKVPAVQKAKKKVADVMIKNPAQKAYEKGLQGKGLAAGGAVNAVISNTVNPLSGQAARLGNEMGQLVRKYS